MLLCAGAGAKWALGNALSTRAEDKELVDLAVTLAPHDPQTLYASAVIRERTFDPQDAAESLQQLTAATALAPNNYALWLALGKAREAAGDRPGALEALRYAKGLAPNYSRVCWAFGNALLRDGQLDAGFSELRQAAIGDHKYRPPLVAAAQQVFSGDAARINAAVGNSPSVLAALALAYAQQNSFDEAIGAWRRIPEDQRTTLAEPGVILLSKAIDGKKFRMAAEVANDLAGSDKFKIAEIYNGGFEHAIVLQNAAAFDWVIADGTNPQVVMTNGKKHGGEFSLLLVFRSPGREFRQISQKVPSEPGMALRFESFVLTDIKSPGVKFRWEIASAKDGNTIASTEPFIANEEWAPASVDFTVPSDTDGIIVRLSRNECVLPSCAFAGNLWLDDIRLTRR